MGADIFTLTPVQYPFPGKLISASVGSNILCVLCFVPGSDKYVQERSAADYRLIKVDLAASENAETISVKLKKPDDAPQSISLHPFGTHLLMFTAKGDTYHCHFGRGQLASERKLRCLSQLQGLHLSCVAWTQPSKRNGLSLATSTGLVVLGSQTGDVYESELEPNNVYFKRNVRFLRLLAHLPLREPVSSVVLSTFPLTAERFLVLVATPTRMYTIVGNASISPYERNGTAVPSLLPIFRQMLSNPVFQEFPSAFPYASCQLVSPYNQADGWPSTPQSFLWQTEPGLYYGDTDFSREKSTSENILCNTKLFPYPSDTVAEEKVVPIAALSIPYYFVLLYEDGKVSVVWNLDLKVCWEGRLPALPSSPVASAVVERIVDGVIDPAAKTMWIVTNLRIVELAADNPNRNVWLYYLQKERFDLALAHAEDAEQRDLILLKQAEKHFAMGRYSLAARCFADSNRTDLKHVCDLYLAKNEFDGLKVFLQLRLNRESDGDLQRTIAEWLLRLHVREIEHLRAENLQDELFAASENQETLLRHREEEIEFTKNELIQFALKWRSLLDLDSFLSLLVKHDLESEAERFCSETNDETRSFLYKTSANLIGAVSGNSKKAQPLPFLKSDDLLQWFAPLYMESLEVTELSLRLLASPPDLQLWLPVLSMASLCRDRKIVVVRLLEVFCQMFQRYPQLRQSTDWTSLALVLAVHAGGDSGLVRQTLHFIKSARWLPALYLSNYACRSGAIISPLIMQCVGRSETAIQSALKAGDVALAEQVALQLSNQSLVTQSRVWKSILSAKASQAKWTLSETMAFVREILHQLERQYSVAQSLSSLSPISDNGNVERSLCSIPVALINDVLRLEDILPLFQPLPPFPTLLKEVRHTLVQFSKRLDALDAEKAATRSFKSRWTSWLASHRHASVTLCSSQTCRLCSVTLFKRQCYTFPLCGHAVHADCLLDTVATQLGFPENQQLLQLHDKLAALVCNAQADKDAISAVKLDIDAIIARDCPLCSTLAIEASAQPNVVFTVWESLLPRSLG